MRIFLSAATLLLAVNTLCAQTPHMKFGKPLMKDLTMTNHPLDTAAAAVVLVDYGESRFIYNKTEGGFQIQFERYTRIKIFNPDGYKWADVSVPVYNSNGNKERVSGIKGNTYNLVNGKIETTKLGKGSKFEEDLTENWTLEKFTLPNVKEGSVIEYVYTITSDFIFQLQDWQFQSTIPTVWSEYKVAIPEYFDYKQLSQGFVPITIKENSVSNGSINFLSTSRPSANGSFSSAQGRTSSSTVNYQTNIYRWATGDIPAFKKERYLTSQDDHIAKIQFELATIKYPGRPTQQVMDTWSTLERKLMESDRFGLALKRSGFYKDQLEQITSKYSNPMEIMQGVYSFVQDHMEWNGVRSKYVDVSLKKAFDEREGNTADINLLMVSMLRAAGLEANPVILSTRDHGKVIEFYPIISRFNYVIAEVILDGKSYLLDATDQYCPINTLPYRCLNKQGRRIAENPGWVNLIEDKKLVVMTQINLDLGEDGSLNGTMVEKQKGYYAASVRKKIIKEGQDEFVTEKFKDQAGWSIKGYSFDNLETKNESLIAKYEISIAESAESLGGLIYLNPIFSEDLKDNPFKTENRTYPVDYGSQSTQTYVASINIPEGYAVDEMPDNVALAMPDAAGTFRYSISQNGNTLQVVSSLSIKKTEFNAQEYPNLREFYNHVVDKHNQQIVLKKI